MLNLIMFILVPDTVKKSLSNGTVPKTEIHFPNGISPHRRDASVPYCGSRDDAFGRYICECPTHHLSMMRTCWVSCDAQVPFNQEYLSSQGEFIQHGMPLHGLHSRHGFVELRRGTGVTSDVLQLVPGKTRDLGEEDEFESLESPRSFASSSSSSSKDDTASHCLEGQDPMRHHPVHNTRKQIPNPWGSASYSDLITMAITSTPDKLMTLSEIYAWIVKNVPYFNDKGSYLSVQGWKNAVRHTLSLRKRFVRVPDPERPYKSMWTISDDYKRVRSSLKSKDKRRNMAAGKRSEPMELS